MHSGETTHTNFIVFGLTWPGLEPTIYHTRGEHVNYYTTDAVKFYYRDQIKYLIIMCINNIAFLTEFLVCILERKSHEYTIPTAHSTTLWVIIHIITTYHQKRNHVQRGYKWDVKQFTDVTFTCTIICTKQKQLYIVQE